MALPNEEELKSIIATFEEIDKDMQESIRFMNEAYSSFLRAIKQYADICQRLVEKNGKSS